MDIGQKIERILDGLCRESGRVASEYVHEVEDAEAAGHIVDATLWRKVWDAFLDGEFGNLPDFCIVEDWLWGVRQQYTA